MIFFVSSIGRAVESTKQKSATTKIVAKSKKLFVFVGPPVMVCLWQTKNKSKCCSSYQAAVWAEERQLAMCREGSGRILSYWTIGLSPGICCARNVKISLSKKDRLCHGNN